MKKFSAVIFLTISLLLGGRIKCHAEEYAFLISAGYTTHPYEALDGDSWTDLFLIYEALVEHQGYDPENVFVFYGNGNNYNYPNSRYQVSTRNWGHMVDYDNSWGTLWDVFSIMGNVITEEDNLLVYWVTGHGGVEDMYSIDPDSYYVAFHRENADFRVSKASVCTLINQIPNYKKRKIFWMTCYSGCMALGENNLCNDKTVMIMSCPYNEGTLSFIDYDYPHSSFNVAVYSLLSFKYPDGHDTDLREMIYDHPGIYIDEDGNLDMQQLNYCIDNYEYNTYITPAYGPAIDLMPVISDQGNIASSVFVNEHIKIENCSLNGFMHNYWTEDLTFKSLNLDGSVIQVSPNQFTRLDRDVKINNSTLIIK